jgi:hypothetical protein
MSWYIFNDYLGNLPLIEDELCCPLRYHSLEKLENLWPKSFHGQAIKDEFLLQ